MTRITLVLSIVLTALLGVFSPAMAAPAATSTPRLDLDAATIPLLQERMGTGSLTSVELTLRYLDRIRTVDPRVNAVLEINPLALPQAIASDAYRHHHGARSALEGIPVLLKDNINTQVQPATAGSRAMVDARATQDAKLVRRLTSAGAVILGKTNLSEWMNFRSPLSTSGWSAVDGLTNNPHVLDRNACGSSSGSAAGVAASLAQVAIGTETDGSIVCPAGVNGIVGLKPTLGLVSRTGLVPISQHQDTAGPMARHVIDAAITLAVLQGRDDADPATHQIPVTQPADYTARLATATLDGKRIGVWRRAGASPQADAVVQRSVESLQAAGATVVEVSLPNQDAAFANEITALAAEFKAEINAYLPATPGVHPRSLAELIEFNRNDPVELQHFGQEIFEFAQVSPPVTAPEVQQARQTATGLQRAAIDDLVAAHDLDAIMAPSSGPAWRSTLGQGDAGVLGSASPAAVAGYPNISVPAGFAGALPIGVSFFGSRWNDAGLIEIAYAFERTVQARRAPQYLPSIG